MFSLFVCLFFFVVVLKSLNPELKYFHTSFVCEQREFGVGGWSLWDKHGLEREQSERIVNAEDACAVLSKDGLI